MIAYEPAAQQPLFETIGSHLKPAQGIILFHMSYLNFVVFGYVGGLCVFLGTFSQILIHYLIRLVLAICMFLGNFKRRRMISRRREGINFQSPNELVVDYQDEEEGRSAQLYHAATDNITRSFDVIDEDDADMGNILINASIG